MNLETQYLAARQTIDHQNAFGRALNERLMPRLFKRLLLDAPREVWRLYAVMFQSYRRDAVALVDQRLKDQLRAAYEETVAPAERDDVAYEVYLSDAYVFALARRVQREVPGADFEGLLAIHDFRRSELPILKEKKLLASAATALFALMQKSDLKLLEGLTLKLPYDDIPTVVQQWFWLLVGLAAALFCLYYVALFRARVRVQREVREVLCAGKVIADAQRRRPSPRLPLNRRRVGRR